jgi:hypothetical protein
MGGGKEVGLKEIEGEIFNTVSNIEHKKRSFPKRVFSNFLPKYHSTIKKGVSTFRTPFLIMI